MTNLPCNQCAAGCEGSTTLSHMLNGLTLTKADEQPPIVEMETIDGVFIKQMFLRQAGTIVPQHSHVYDHGSLLARGSVRVWRDDVLDGDHTAPEILFIPAAVKHTFMSLVDDTIVYCIHNLLRSEEVEILEEHHLLGDS